MKQLLKDNCFKKDFARCARRNYNQEKFNAVILALIKGEDLPSYNRNHKLVGNYAEH
jgi:mRNA-degrading endonuclease YafQ of YafQ-DinJ toxin-antitoxin module